MKTDKNDIEGFKDMYRKEMLRRRGICKVEYFGSTKDSWRWEAGKSDLDIKVYGDDISGEVKIEGVLLVEELNYKFNLYVEDLPLQHWTPIYIDNSPAPPPLPPLSRRQLDRLLEDELVRSFTEALRELAKMTAVKVGWPLTYKDWWNIAKFMRQIEGKTPYPKLSRYLL